MHLVHCLARLMQSLRTRLKSFSAKTLCRLCRLLPAMHRMQRVLIWLLLAVCQFAKYRIWFESSNSTGRKVAGTERLSERTQTRRDRSDRPTIAAISLQYWNRHTSIAILQSRQCYRADKSYDRSNRFIESARHRSVNDVNHGTCFLWLTKNFFQRTSFGKF